MVSLAYGKILNMNNAGGEMKANSAKKSLSVNIF